MINLDTYKINFLAIVLLLSTNMALANNTAISSGAWETATNWSTGVAPLAADIVIVPAGLTMTINASGNACGSLSIAATGAVTINTGASLSIGGNFSNAGTFVASPGSTLTFNSAANSTLTGGGAYTIAGTIVLNMGSAMTMLDVQAPNFIAGINAGGKYYFTFTRGTWKMNNAGALNDCYNSGSSNALTIAYGVTIESDAGTMNLCANAPTGSAILSGKLYMNGGIVNIQTGQGFNSGQDFQYSVNGGTPQLFLTAGTLNVGAGFNALGGGDFIDFHMTGGTLILALNGYSNWITFQLADVVGGKTFMSGGLIILQDACNANIEDLDMGGANVAATQYSVTGGTVQLGYINTQAGATFFGIDAQPATNYPNIDFEAGVPKNGSAFNTGNINMLSLNVNANMTFDATGFPNVTIMSNNGAFAFDDEGGFIQANNTVTFAGSVPQVIRSTSLANEIFYNLTIANTSGNVILGVTTTVTNQLNFTNGSIDASNYSLVLPAGNVDITGASATSYIITGNGVATTGQLTINNISANTSTLLPIGTPSYYLPATINPGANAGNSYSAFVFQGATTNAVSSGPAFSAANQAKIVNAVWNISRTAGSGNATLTLNWTSSGTTLEGSTFQGYGINIGITQYTGGAWQTGTGNGDVSTQTATSSFGSFSQFGVVGNGVILPIVIADFGALLNSNKTVLLSWRAPDDGGIGDFDVQKSADGIRWKTIGNVHADDTPTGESAYSLTDANPAPGENYYRLTIHIVDGSVTYSSIRMINLSPPTGITLFPNPANHFVNVSAANTGSEITIRFINTAGQVLTSFIAGNSGNSVTSIDTGNYPPGMYLVQVLGEGKIVMNSLVLIEH